MRRTTRRQAGAVALAAGAAFATPLAVAAARGGEEIRSPAAHAADRFPAATGMEPLPGADQRWVEIRTLGAAVELPRLNPVRARNRIGRPAEAPSPAPAPAPDAGSDSSGSGGSGGFGTSGTSGTSGPSSNSGAVVQAPAPPRVTPPAPPAPRPAAPRGGGTGGGDDFDSLESFDSTG